MSIAKHEVLELRQKKAALVAEARKLLETGKKSETKKLSAEEEKKYDAIMADVEEHSKKIEQEERLMKHEAEMEETLKSEAPDTRAAMPEDATARGSDKKEILLRHQFISYIRTGNVGRELQERSMVAGSGVDGGFLVTPITIAQDILKAADEILAIRGLINNTTLEKSESLGFPTVETDVGDANWTEELAFGNEGEIKFGLRELKPNPLAKYVKISNKLLRSSFKDVEKFVIQRLAYKVAVSLEKAYLTGHGSKQPLGMFVASDKGIDTTRDVPFGAHTAFTGDHLIDMQTLVGDAYQKDALWVLHRDWLGKIRKLKNTVDGQYVWMPGLQLGKPDTILGKPYTLSAYAPNATTSGTYPIIYGNLKEGYMAVDALDIQVQRLVELFAATNQTAILIRQESDGQPVNKLAFARGKVSA